MTPTQLPAIGPAPDSPDQFKDENGDDVYHYNAAGRQGSTGEDWRKWAGSMVAGNVQQWGVITVLKISGAAAECPYCAIAVTGAGTAGTVYSAGVLVKKDVDAFMAPSDPNVRVTAKRGTAMW